MTESEVARLAVMESKQDAMAEDIGEIKVVVQAMSTERQESRAELRAKIAVLEDRVNLLRYLVLGAGTSGAGSLVWHGMNALGG